MNYQASGQFQPSWTLKEPAPFWSDYSCEVSTYSFGVDIWLTCNVHESILKIKNCLGEDMYVGNGTIPTTNSDFHTTETHTKTQGHTTRTSEKKSFSDPSFSLYWTFITLCKTQELKTAALLSLIAAKCEDQILLFCQTINNLFLWMMSMLQKR